METQKRLSIRPPIALLLVSILLLGAPTAAQVPPSPGAGADKGGEVLGVVEGIPITQAEWDRLAEPYFREVEAEAGRPLSEDDRRLLRQNLLRELIRERLWLADAQRRGLKVKVTDVDARMKKSSFFLTSGRYDEAKFQAFKRSPTSNYPELHALVARGMILEEYTRWMERRFGPKESELRQAFRERTSLASIRFLVLGADAVSLDPEATEAEIRAYYDEHPSEFLAPEEARLQYVKVQSPGAPAAGDSAREANAEASLQAAKELLAAILAGAPPETAARVHGGFHDSGPFRVGEPMRGLGRSDALAAAVRATEAGAWIREPIRIGPYHVVARIVEKKDARPIPFREAAGLAKRRADLAKRDVLSDSLALDEIRKNPGEYRRPFLTAKKDVENALKRARKAAGISDTARVWIDSVRTTLPMTLAAERRLAAASKAMRDIVNDLRRGETVERVAARYALSLSRVEAWRGQPPARPWLAEGALLDSLYDLRAGSIFGPRIARDSIFVTRVERVDPFFLPPYTEIRANARAAATQRRRQQIEREAEAWFGERRDRYMTPPRFVVDLVHFDKTSPDTLAVPEDSIGAYYAAHPIEFTEPARVRVRHILFRVDPSDANQRREEARSRARAARARIQKGEDFAALARALSDDKASGARGGELGEYLRSQLVPEFAAAAFALPAGEVSEPVLTTYGYHLIQVDQRIDPRLRPLDECRSEIRKFLAGSMADSVARRAAEALAPAAARDSARFDELAASLGARAHRFGPVGSSDRLGAVGPVPGLGDWLAPVAEGGVTPEPLPVAEGYIVARKVRDVPPAPATFAAVRERAVGDYQQARRRALADSVAAHWREAFSGASGAVPDLDSLAVPYGGLRLSKPFGRSGPIPDLARDGALGRDSLYLERIFASKPGDLLPPLQGSSGTLFARVETVGEAPASEFAKRRDELRREMLEQRMEAWAERLRSRASVTIRRPDLRRLLN
jgi:parvulin-like peptidyl-prolyl isomerase